MSADFDQLVAWAAEEVRDTVEALPEALRERVQSLPVTYEPWPNPGLQEDGIAPDTLGLFVGPDFADEEMTPVPLPPQIILFVENLWDFSDRDEETYRAEVHTTFLHELGHYLGLDEEDLFNRGLE